MGGRPAGAERRVLGLNRGAAPAGLAATRGLGARFSVLALAALVGGCASISEGVTRAVLEPKAAEIQVEDRHCEVRGPDFVGLAAAFEPSGGSTGAAAPSPLLKVLMVHGIGGPQPGYSSRLQATLIGALGLDVTDPRSKRIELRHLGFGDTPLGVLTVNRYADQARSRELLFYELTWSAITAGEKRALAYDQSARHASQRASLNDSIKEFLNARISDPLIYLGSGRDKILDAVDQSMCWMAAGGWSALPEQAARACDPLRAPGPEPAAPVHYAFVTHSLGSRILLDALIRASESGRDGAARAGGAFARELGDRPLSLFMLANQLSLLQLGRERPPVTLSTALFCPRDAPRRAERLAERLSIVAFSDPNDLLSYPVEPEFAENYIDSRLCPAITNVTLNIARPQDLFGFGQFANPLEAHTGYDRDGRVAGFIVEGVGQGRQDPVQRRHCNWLRTERW